MAHIENTVVGRPVEKQQSIGLASRLLNCLGMRLVYCSERLRERITWMMKWTSEKQSNQTVFFTYGPSKLFRCYFELEPPIDSSFPKFLAKIDVFEDYSSTGDSTNWKENPFFGMSEEQMKITLDLAETIEEGEESGQQED